MRKLLLSLFLLSALAPLTAWAQGAACPFRLMSPTTVTGSRILTVNDNCGMLIVTGAATITIPGAGVLPPGWNVWIKAQGATATVTPTTASLDGAATSISVTTGDGIGLRSDGTNAFSTGLGVAH